MTSLLHAVRDRLLYLIVSCVGRTIDFREENTAFLHQRLKEEQKGVILSFWHNRSFFLIYYLSRFLRSEVKFAAMVSQSRDGQIMSNVVNQFGGHVSRGSSSRQGKSALRNMIRWARNDNAIVLTPDGPRGPKYQVQPGVSYLSIATGLPIVPISYGVSRCQVLNSWDEYMVPHPYTTGLVACGDPIWPPEETGDAHKKRLQQNVQAEMDNLQQYLVSLGYDQS